MNEHHAVLHETTEVQVGTDTPIIVDKLFGPRVFCPVRVTAKMSGRTDVPDYWLIEQADLDDNYTEVARLSACPGEGDEECRQCGKKFKARAPGVCPPDWETICPDCAVGGNTKR